MCKHYIARGLCIDFPDWSIAAAGSEASVKIGYEYGRFMTGEEQQIEPDLNEEAMHTDSDQVVPDPQEERSMVATSAEVYTRFVSDCSNTIVYLMDFFFVLLFYKVQFVMLCGFGHSRSSGLMQSTWLMKHHPFLSQHLKNTVSRILLHCTV